MEQICRLLSEHFAITFGLAVALSALADVPPAASAARIEASEVIRDVENAVNNKAIRRDSQIVFWLTLN